MKHTVVVTYQVRPERREEHVELIHAVFRQLQDERPTNVSYQVVCLNDGKTFIHTSTADTEDGSNPLVSLASFREFSRDVSSRTVDPPDANDADVVGSYRPGADPQTQ
jgi:hypothetical protein